MNEIKLPTAVCRQQAQSRPSKSEREKRQKVTGSAHLKQAILHGQVEHGQLRRLGRVKDGAQALSLGGPCYLAGARKVIDQVSGPSQSIDSCGVELIAPSALFVWRAHAVRDATSRCPTPANTHLNCLGFLRGRVQLCIGGELDGGRIPLGRFDLGLSSHCGLGQIACAQLRCLLHSQVCVVCRLQLHGLLLDHKV